MIWIIGGGRFGARSVKILSGMSVPPEITVVDRSKKALTALEEFGVKTVQADGIEYLYQNLTDTGGPKWVIPCVPFHLYYRWLLEKLDRRAASIPVPEAFASDLPHPMPADQGGFFISQADFICPPDCPEPAGFCTHTGKPRPGTLYRDLGEKTWPEFQVTVLRSRQLAPGLGGLKKTEMFEGLRRISKTSGRWLIGTACKCHGVLHGLEYNRK